MKILVLLFAALLVAGCGEKLPDDPEIKQALKNAVWGKDLEWRDEEGLVTHERQLKESSDGRRTYTMGWGIDRQHLRGESEPYSGWVKAREPNPMVKPPKDEEVVRMVFHVKGGHRDGPYKYWHSNGQMKEEGFNIAGKPHGRFTGWYKNGQKSYEVNFNEEGPAKYWNSRGEEVETLEESKK